MAKDRNALPVSAESSEPVMFAVQDGRPDSLRDLQFDKDTLARAQKWAETLVDSGKGMLVEQMSDLHQTFSAMLMAGRVQDQKVQELLTATNEIAHTATMVKQEAVARIASEMRTSLRRGKIEFSDLGTINDKIDEMRNALVDD